MFAFKTRDVINFQTNCPPERRGFAYKEKKNKKQKGKNIKKDKKTRRQIYKRAKIQKDKNVKRQKYKKTKNKKDKKTKM